MHKILVSLAALGIAAAPAAPGYHAASPIALPDGGWDYASVSRDGAQVFVARGDSVSVVDVPNGSVRSIGSIQRGHAALPLPDGKRLLVTSGNDNSVRILDIASGGELARIAVGKKPDAALLDAATGDALVMDAGDGSVAVIDTMAQRVRKTIAVKPGLEAGALAKDGTLFVNNEDANELEVVDLAKGTIAAPIALTGCEGPTGLGYDARLDRLVSACANGKAAIVDAGHRKLLGLVDIGRGPDTVLIDAAHDRALIPCGRDGVLDVIALDGSAARVARVATEAGARTAAYDSAHDTVYLPTARFGAPPPSGGRPAPLAGSAHLVVLKPN